MHTMGCGTKRKFRKRWTVLSTMGGRLIGSSAGVGEEELFSISTSSLPGVSVSGCFSRWCCGVSLCFFFFFFPALSLRFSSCGVSLWCFCFRFFFPPLSSRLGVSCDVKASLCSATCCASKSFDGSLVWLVVVLEDDESERLRLLVVVILDSDSFRGERRRDDSDWERLLCVGGGSTSSWSKLARWRRVTGMLSLRFFFPPYPLLLVF